MREHTRWRQVQHHLLGNSCLRRLPTVQRISDYHHQQGQREFDPATESAFLHIKLPFEPEVGSVYVCGSLFTSVIHSPVFRAAPNEAAGPIISIASHGGSAAAVPITQFPAEGCPLVPCRIPTNSPSILRDFVHRVHSLLLRSVEESACVKSECDQSQWCSTDYGQL